LKFLSFPYRVIRWMMLTRPIRFTRFGTFYVLFALGVGAAAINTGNNLLYLILGILLGLIVLSGFLSDSGLWGIATAWAPVGSLYAGEKGLMESRLRKGWFPGVAVIIESQWNGLPAFTSFAPWIPAHGSVLLRTEITPSRRGYLTLDNCRYSTRFPFGFFQKSHTEMMSDRWVVYPRIRRLPAAFWDRQGKDFARDSSNRKGLGSVPFILRDYRAGDPLRQVDWKTSAKRAHLMVKEMEEEADEGDLFYLEAWPGSLTSAQMEDFISFVVSLIFSVYERGRPVGLIAPGRLFQPETSRPHLRRILEFLALVDPSADQGLPLPPFPVARNPQTHDILSLWRSYGR
jgi:uncharacterized protein (DUF58 family)